MADIAPFTKDVNPNIRVLKDGYTLSNLQTLLSKADEAGFGIPACNIRSRGILQGVFDAAWELKAPVIVEIAESEAGYIPMMPDKLSNMVHEEIEAMISKYGYSVPVCLHHDHIQKDVDGCVDRAIENGFSSVEVDLSKKPIEENAKKCAEVIEKVHPLGISVEVEEGEIGAASALSDPNVEENIAEYYTKTEDALKLVEMTKPDALAFFVGNGHGVYLKTPNIGYERIKEIAEAIRPFGAYGVLHGGSGLTPEMFKKAVEAGARKFNYATTLSNIWFKYYPDELAERITKKGEEENRPFRKVLYHFEEELENLEMPPEARMEVAEHMKLMMKEAFLCDGKADLYK